jgi:hypothetical protein
VQAQHLPFQQQLPQESHVGQKEDLRLPHYALEHPLSWFFLRQVRVAFKTVYGHSSVGMTTLTKVFRGGADATGCCAGVAVDAGLQAETASASTDTYRVISLMFEQVHVVSTHVSWLCNALHTTRFFDGGSGHAGQILAGLPRCQ